MDAVDRAFFIKNSNLRLQQELREALRKESTLRKSFLDDWYPTVLRQHEDEAKLRAEFQAERAREEAFLEKILHRKDGSPQRQELLVIPPYKKTDERDVVVRTPADELKRVMQGHITLLRDLDMKHEMTIRSTEML